MQVKETIIRKVDLKKLMKAKGIKNIYQLAKVSGLSTSQIYPALNHKHLVMSANVWDKIKVCL